MSVKWGPHFNKGFPILPDPAWVPIFPGKIWDPDPHIPRKMGTGGQRYPFSHDFRALLTTIIIEKQ